MKILAVQEAPAKNTLIRLILGPITRFVEKEGVSELHVSFGPTKPLSQRKITIFLRKVVILAKQNKLRTIAIEWDEVRKIADKKISDKKLGELMAIAFQMANFEFTVYKQEPKDGFDTVDEVAIVNAPKLARESFVRGEMIAMEVNSTRALSNTPGGDMTPKILSSVAKTIAKGTKVEVQVLGKKELEKFDGDVRISLRADRQLPIEIIKSATLELQGLESQINIERDRDKMKRVKFIVAGEVRGPGN